MKLHEVVKKAVNDVTPEERLVVREWLSKYLDRQAPEIASLAIKSKRVGHDIVISGASYGPLLFGLRRGTQWTNPPFILSQANIRFVQGINVNDMSFDWIKSATRVSINPDYTGSIGNLLSRLDELSGRVSWLNIGTSANKDQQSVMQIFSSKIPTSLSLDVGKQNPIEITFNDYEGEENGLTNDGWNSVHLFDDEFELQDLMIENGLEDWV